MPRNRDHGRVEGIATDRNGLQAKARKKFFGQEAGPTTANVDNWHPEGPGATKRLSYRAPAGGWYYAEVKLGSAGFGPYSLTIAKR